MFYVQSILMGNFESISQLLSFAHVGINKACAVIIFPMFSLLAPLSEHMHSSRWDAKNTIIMMLLRML